MATFEVTSKTISSITVEVSGLSSDYKGNRYFYWYIDGEYDGGDGPLTNTNEISHTFSGLEPGTEYFIQLSIQWYTANGVGDVQYTPFSLDGEDDGAITDAIPVTPRPDNWGWWSEKTPLKAVKIRANEWNHFTACINNFRVYKGKNSYSFTTVYPGDAISASICMEAYAAIYEIADADDMPGMPFNGYPMKASFFNDLRDALNNVE